MGRFQVQMQVNYDNRNVVRPLDTRRSGPHNWLQIFFMNFPMYSEKNSGKKYMLKVYKRHTRTRCELLSKLSSKKNIKTTSFGCLYC